MQPALSINPEGMSAFQLLLAEILFNSVAHTSEPLLEPVVAHKGNIEEEYDDVGCVLGDEMYEALQALREAGEPSGLSSHDRPLVNSYSRHYECEEVAYQVKTGQWVGWTYWTGGGKHGEPDAIDWLPHAYLLDVVGEKTVVKYEFAPKEAE